MSLDFLSLVAPSADGGQAPIAPSADGGQAPIARSPMEGSAAEEGARFELRDGWNVAVGYGSQRTEIASQTVGWADTSHVSKLELQGTAEALEAAAGVALPFGTAVRHEDAWWCRLTRTRAIVIGGSPAVRDRLGAADAVNLVDVTSNFAALTIVGPLAREVFARFSAIDLRPQITPVGALRPGSVARQPAIVICEAEDRYLYLFGWATGEYVWSVVADAGHHLGGRPIGADDLALLPGPAAVQEASRA